jgi:hypothetical protein
MRVNTMSRSVDATFAETVIRFLSWFNWDGIDFLASFLQSTAADMQLASSTTG